MARPRTTLAEEQWALNPKHEIPAFAEAASRRQAKFETISNCPNAKFKPIDLQKFGHLDLGFVSDFGIRISNLLGFDGFFSTERSERWKRQRCLKS
jgi:hypothetical protein